MNVNTERVETPLQNLFSYIRDLYNARQDCLDCLDEPGEPKVAGTNYWALGDLLTLSQNCARKNIPEFDLGLEGAGGQVPDYLLKVRRMALPPKPVMEQLDSATVLEPLDGTPAGAAPDAGDAAEKAAAAAAAKKRKEYEQALRDYQRKYALPLEVNACYDALHALYYELRGRSGKRLHLSLGLVAGEIGGKVYRNFLFHVPLRLKLKNHEIRIETDTFAYKIFCEQFFTELLDAHFTKESPYVVEERKREVLVAVDRFNARTLEWTFNPEYIRTEFYDKGWDILAVFPDKDYKFYTEDRALDFTFYPDIPDRLTFSFSPVIQTRLVADQLAVSKDASAIVRTINELQGAGEMGKIPDFFKKLFALPGEPALQAAPEEEGRFLFPLPYNQEQFEIARRLREQDAVTVKGPPGTGKSHTIANLISHFVSEGKSILVVSHNAKALSVLKEKLPRGIQDLAVSLVNEGKGNEGLKASVSAIIRHISQHYEEGRIESLEGQLSAMEHKYALLLSDMYRVVQANGERLALANPVHGLQEDRSAYEWAVFLHEEPDRETVLLKDPVDYKTETEGLAERLQTLTVIANQFQPGDFDLIHYQFLQDHAFPEVQQLRRIEVRLEEITAAIQLDDYARVDPAVADEAFVQDYQQLGERWEGLQGTQQALELFRHKDFDREGLFRFLQDSAPYREQVTAAEDRLLPYDLDLAPLLGVDPDILYRQVNQLIVKFGEHQHLGWMSRNLLDKSLKLFFSCKVNYIPAADLEHFRLIETAINRDRCLKQLHISCQNYLRRFGIPCPDAREAYKELDLLAAFIDGLSGFNVTLRQKKLPLLDPRDPTFGEQRSYLSGLAEFVEYKKIRAFLEEARQRIIHHDQAHPLIFNIARALEFVNRGNYELYLSQYREKRQRQPAAIRFDQLYKEVGRVLPHTVLFIKDRSGAGVKLFPTVEDLEKDLFFARLRSFLEQVLSRTKGASGLLQELQSVKRGMERQTAELISYKAWFNKSRSVSDLQKAALNAWLNDLINIGKGFGKNTARNMASAIQNMQIAKEAVPIWIMPQETAITFFPEAGPGQFDLLIIDEASQCDISSLNLVFRCKKCLIVGDENQTSVAADRRWFSIGRTNELMDKYLISHRFKTQFDVNNKNNSIYTLSGVIYPNIVTLTEHFRCLPEIIGYSSQYIYNREIVALKTATERPFGDPIGIVRTEDDPESEEKPLMVRKVAESIGDYILRYKEGSLRRLPTIGIITLDSSNQQHHNALLREIAGNELIKEYEDQLELLIGTSREFQGDERDVVLMTITAAHTVKKERDRISFKPPRAATTEEYMRIYNVAASRAKERSVLFHSIHPEAVALMNPDCYRKMLIDYYQLQASRFGEPAAQAVSLPDLLEQVDTFGGDFQGSVCRFLYAQGWGDYLHPQLEVGKYRIDFGLIAGNRKLAIECDGERHASDPERIREDIARQLILERAGWHFFRIQSTDWYYRREAVGEALLAWIKENTATV
ncbi:AAA domain-containing protein [Dinghuibacter silviterrae]|uniref:Uncharacterized protein DUF559 n=1 Tax=Dinghuibacter silviterrae TaxID=1539049 RepID=A0A4R8DT72_9BACT|nr:AAA domain-containing protein [Dinghuibacter silviterrae]TDX01098.1 uncharacterized protein DUF559 [Dinghuibacter silviterrae]